MGSGSAARTVVELDELERLGDDVGDDLVVQLSLEVCVEPVDEDVW